MLFCWKSPKNKCQTLANSPLLTWSPANQRQPAENVPPAVRHLNDIIRPLYRTTHTGRILRSPSRTYMKKKRSCHNRPADPVRTSFFLQFERRSYPLWTTSQSIFVHPTVVPCRRKPVRLSGLFFLGCFKKWNSSCGPNLE